MSTSERSLRNRKLRRETYWMWLIDYLLAHPCADCGATDLLVLEFDHVRGKKLGDVGTMIKRGRSWKVILTEIAKCDVICANDHRRRTATKQKHTRWKRIRMKGAA